MIAILFKCYSANFHCNHYILLSQTCKSSDKVAYGFSLIIYPILAWCIGYQIRFVMLSYIYFMQNLMKVYPTINLEQVHFIPNKTIKKKTTPRVLCIMKPGTNCTCILIPDRSWTCWTRCRFLVLLKNLTLSRGLIGISRLLV